VQAGRYSWAKWISATSFALGSIPRQWLVPGGVVRAVGVGGVLHGPRPRRSPSITSSLERQVEPVSSVMQPMSGGFLRKVAPFARWPVTLPVQKKAAVAAVAEVGHGSAQPLQPGTSRRCGPQREIPVLAL